MIVADVYAAGEAPIEGIDRDHLVAAIKAHGHRQALALPAPEALPKFVRELAPARATTSCASAPATSRNGPMRCPGQLAEVSA